MLQATDHNAGLLLNFTGNGKGKTTAALGVTLRALGWDWQVAFLQFIKSDRQTGERRFFATYFPEMQFKQCGLGCTFIHTGDHNNAAHCGWEEARYLLQEFPGGLLVLDELNIAIHQGFIDVAEAVNALQNRRRGLNVIITGRYARAEIMKICDLVSEIESVKHYLQKSIPAVKGLDL